MNLVPRPLKKWYRRQARFGPAYAGWYLRRDTVRGAAFYYRWASALAPREMARRAAVAASLSAANPLFELSDEVGFARFDLAEHPSGREAIDRCRVAFDAAYRDGRFEGSDAAEFRAACRLDLLAPENASVLRFVLSDDVLAPICAYLRTFPILLRPSLWYSPNDVDFGKGTQRYHMDQSDHRQVKLFVYLDRVDAGSGPLTILPAGRSQEMYTRLRREGVIRRRYQGLEDERVRDVLGDDAGTVMLGDAYGGVAVDTCRCYHFGSRPPVGQGRPRRVLLLQFASPFSKYMPAVGRRARALRAPAPTGTAAERAGLLLGYSHLARHNVHPRQLTAPPA